MAEINIQNRNRKGLHKPPHKRSTRVDLMPMVDLGFLLLTFFVFTTTMSEAKVMKMVEPDNSGPTKDPICASCALTFLADAGNTLYYYEGAPENATYKKTVYTAGGIRDIIIQKKKKVLSVRGRDELMLIIKAGKRATFKNLVDMVDEANITGVKKYYMDELTEKEKAFVDSLQQ
jgi:biopolymer transport protein ExbD